MYESVGLVTLGDSGDVLEMSEMFPKPTGPRDITAGVLQRFFMAIPSGDSVSKGSMCVIGDQGCGKSVFVQTLTAHAYKRYGRRNVHVIYTDDIRVAMDLIDDTPVQLVIIDDAMTYASSRQVGQQTDIIKVYNRSRHVFESKLNGKPGVILYVWAWQRFKELDPSFRQTDIMVFKTGISEPSEAQLIEKFIGTKYAHYLNEIWDRMKMGDQDVKSDCVARISSLDVARGTGMMHLPRVACDFPEIITHDEHFADEDVENDILDDYVEKPEWRWRIEIHRLHERCPDLTQQEIAEQIGELRGTKVRQGYVSESLRKVRELIESK